MMAERFTKTADANAAVDGREIELLSRSGVDWKPGMRGHVTCPYPDHGGKGDWRYDERKKLIYCTCLPKPHSVWDHLSKMRGADPKADGEFEASKVEGMELLGRTDLIKKRRAPGQAASRRRPPTWHRNFEAARLLNPPD